MHIDTDTSELLVIKSRKTKTGRLILGAGFVLTVLAILLFIFNTGRYTLIYGAGTGGLLLVISYLALYEQSVVKFDLKSRNIKWTRVKSFQRNEGIIPFSSVRDFVLQRPKVDYSYNMSRLVIITNNEEIPLTETYLRHSRDIMDILSRVRSVLNLSDQ